MNEKSQEQFVGMAATVSPAATGGLKKIHGQEKQRRGTLTLVLSCLLVLMCPIVAVSEGNTGAATFLGPLPGMRLFYEADSNQKMELRGLTYDQDGAILVEERIIFPTQQSMLNSGCITELSSLYGISVNGSKILKKEFPLNGMTVYHTDLDLKGTTWGRKITLTPSNSSSVETRTATTSQCNITKRSKQKIFGEDRVVLEISGEYCVPRKYASGIGLIDYAGFKLVRIEKHGQVLYAD